VGHPCFFVRNTRECGVTRYRDKVPPHSGLSQKVGRRSNSTEQVRGKGGGELRSGPPEALNVDVAMESSPSDEGRCPAVLFVCAALLDGGGLGESPLAGSCGTLDATNVPARAANGQGGLITKGAGSHRTF